MTGKHGRWGYAFDSGREACGKRLGVDVDTVLMTFRVRTSNSRTGRLGKKKIWDQDWPVQEMPILLFGAGFGTNFGVTF